MTERALLAIADALFAIADALEKPKRKRASSSRTMPPQDMATEDKHELKRWCLENEPWAVPHLRAIVDDMLMWHRAEGKSRVSWLITAQRWIKAQRVKYGQDKPTKGSSRRDDIIEAGRCIDAALGGSLAESDADEVVFDVSAGETSEPEGDAFDLQRRAGRHSGTGSLSRSASDHAEGGTVLAYRRRNTG